MMGAVLDYIAQNWLAIFVPILILLLSLIALFRIKKLALDRLSNWAKEVTWPADSILVQSIKRPLYIISIVLSIALGIQVSSQISAEWKSFASDSLWTLFVLAISLAVYNILLSSIAFFNRRFFPVKSSPLLRNISISVIIVVSGLIILGIWGAPTSPLILLFGIVGILILLVLRDTVSNYFAALQLASSKHVREGDYIGLENGERGCVVKIGWNNTELLTSEGDRHIIPNSALLKQKVTKFAHSADPGLSRREIEVALLVSQGATNKEIAKQLFIAENTVKTHVGNILEKLELENRQQIAVYASSHLKKPD